AGARITLAVGFWPAPWRSVLRHCYRGGVISRGQNCENQICGRDVFMVLPARLLRRPSAIALAVGIALSTGPILAADLGASCCADLEERIAELEATTASKGNRKISLAISGSVNRVVLWWDDGRSSGTYYGLDSGNLTSRLLFNGRAKITPKVTTG